MNRTANVLTNAAYAVDGITAWISDGFSPFVVACFGLALGSASYHQWHDHPTREHWSHHADELGMYAVFSSLFLVISGAHFWIVALLLWLALHFVARKYSARQTLFVISSFILGGMLFKGLYWESVLTLGIFAGAYVVKIRDHDHGEVFGLGHAMWHIWTAILIAILYEAIK